MFQKTAKNVIQATVLVGAIFGSSYASAAVNVDCPNGGIGTLNLASDIANGTKNSTICVDVPNVLVSNQFVFDIDTPVTSDGTVDGTPSAFKHMWLMGSANIAFLKNQHGLNADGTISDPVVKSVVVTPTVTDDIKQMSIIGIVHGSALKWALSDAWWEAQVDDDGHQLYPNGNPNKAWFAKIAAMQAKGMDIRLEVCGVTLEGAGLTRDDVYSDSTTGFRILVNQGAFGRMSHLHKFDGYAIVSEGWVDTDGNDYEHMHNDRDPR